MAYREFHDEAYYEAPNVNSLFAHTLNTLHGEMQQRAREKRANLDASQRFKFDSGKGMYASDQDILNANGADIAQRARRELRKSGEISGETAQLMEDHASIKNRSKIDWDSARNVEKQIKELAIRDKYYNPETDLKRLQEAEYNGGIADRNERIQNAAGTIHNIDTFNKGRFVADHIQAQKLNQMQNVSEKSGVKNTRLTSAIFMKDDGTPGVSDRHIMEMLNKDPRAEEWYTTAVTKQMDDEVKRMKALGNDPRTSWMNGMSDDDIKAALIDNPSLNIVNGESFANRKKELIRGDLEAGQDMNKKTAVDYSDSYGATGGKFNNTKIGYQPTFIDQAVNFRSRNGARQAGTVGADLTYIDKGGPLKFVTNSPNRANVGTGEIDLKASDNMEFNLRNYGLYVYDDKGVLYPIEGKSVDELKANIDAIPDAYFEQNSTKTPHPLSSEMSVGLNGFAINKSKLINQSLDKLSSLAEEYNKALDTGDEVRANQLKQRMAQVEQLRAMAGNADVDDMELLLSGKQLGISGVQNDMILKATDQDLAKLKTMTNGLDLKDKSKWTEDMREVNDHYIARRNRAIEATKNKPAEAAKPKTVEHTIKGKVYSNDAVEKAAKASGMSVAEYIKAANK